MCMRFIGIPPVFIILPCPAPMVMAWFMIGRLAMAGLIVNWLCCDAWLGRAELGGILIGPAP